MCARSLATFCLLSLSLGIGLAESVLPKRSELVVYLKADTTDSPVVRHMMRELSELMLAAGFRIEWADWKNPTVSPEGADLAAVELRGSCAAPSDSEPYEETGNVRLASTFVSDGQVLPFSWVDCPALSRFLAPLIVREPVLRRDYAYGRAMARLLGHEFYHVLAQTVEHTGTGIAKERFTPMDLLSDHFPYENKVLLKLHSSQLSESGHVPTSRVPTGTEVGQTLSK